MTRAAAAAAVGTLLASCATPRPLPIGYQGQPLRLEPDEWTLWVQAEWEGQTFEQLKRRYDDPRLEEYLAALADRLTPSEVKAAGFPRLRFAVVLDPSPNAFALPNGRAYLHTGLLARLENEAQLAAILAHELTHMTHRHMLQLVRKARSPWTVFGAAIVPRAGVAPMGAEEARRSASAGSPVPNQTARALLGLGLTLAYTASVTGYGNDLEREADEEGLERLVRAGYDPKESPRAFELLREAQGDRGPIEAFFLESRPHLAKRIETTTQLLQTRDSNDADQHRAVNTGDFSLRMRPVLRENALLELRAARFDAAKSQLDRVLGQTPQDPIAQLYYGDLYRLQAQRATSQQDREHLSRLARERYERATELDPALGDPFRQLGLLFYQLEELERAREAFERYLSLEPDAADARRIEEYLTTLER